MEPVLQLVRHREQQPLAHVATVIKCCGGSDIGRFGRDLLGLGTILDRIAESLADYVGCDTTLSFVGFQCYGVQYPINTR